MKKLFCFVKTLLHQTHQGQTSPCLIAATVMTKLAAMSLLHPTKHLLCQIFYCLITQLSHAFYDSFYTLSDEGIIADIAINQTDMGIKNFIASLVDGATEGIPELLDGADGNADHIAGVGTNQQLAIVGQDFLLAGRDNVIHHIPVIVGVRHHRETGIGVDFS